MSMPGPDPFCSFQGMIHLFGINRKKLYLYLPVENNQKTWKKKVRNWPQILTTLRLEFGEQINQYL